MEPSTTESMPKYNHMMDIAFSVVSETEDPFDLTAEELLAGLERRIDNLKSENYEEVKEAFGHCDTYDEDEVV